MPVNFNQQLGSQLNSRVIGLPDGGFVVAWTNLGTTQATTVWMQRFSGSGVALGDHVQVFTTAGQTTLRDIAVASDGRIWVAGTEGATVVLKSFDPSSLVAQTAQITITPAVQPTSVQIDTSTTTAGAVSVMISGPATANPVDNVIQTAEVSSAGVAGAFTQQVLNLNQPSHDIVEFERGGMTITTNGTNHFAFLPGGSPFALGGTGRPTDVLQMRDDLYFVSLQNNTTNVISLQALSVTPAGTIASLGSVSGGFGGDGTTTTGQNVYDSKMVRLDDNRIMVVYVSDGGDNFVSGGVTDGIYMSIYNITTGSVSSAELIENLGTTINEAQLQAVKLSATLLADGRVVVSYNKQATGNTVWGSDVFATVLDERGAAIDILGTAAADNFLGTSFSDVFTGVSSNDVIEGGSGNDTVVFTGSTSRVVDLADPNAFPETTFTLSSIEHLTGSGGSDAFYGNAAFNRLSGGAGNDTLSGRAGVDVLLGSTGDDMLFGGIGADSLSGNADNDSIYGGADADLILGGTGNDLVAGGSGDDTLFGNENEDRVFGDTGNDQIDGGSGNDYLDGGDGDDWVQGGFGNDTLRGEVGADSLNGGDGNDKIIAAADVALVEGGNGTDLLVVASADSDPLNTGLYVDLSGGALLFSNMSTMTEFTGLITGIENLTGTVGGDFLIGSAAANQLRGGTGADTLVGGAGDDTLVGGAGADMFIFMDPANGNDRVSGFETGSDKLALNADTFGDLSTADLATRLTINATATVAANTSAQLLFDNAGSGVGRLFFDADGNGAGAAVLIATLTFSAPAGLTAFSGSDFVFI